MAEPTSCCLLPGSYCARTGALFNVDGIVIDVGWSGEQLRLVASRSIDLCRVRKHLLDERTQRRNALTIVVIHDVET